MIECAFSLKEVKQVEEFIVNFCEEKNDMPQVVLIQFLFKKVYHGSFSGSVRLLLFYEMYAFQKKYVKHTFD